MVTQSFKMKYQSQLPPKISIHPRSDDFINTMPCLLPEKYGRMAVKVVTRIVGAEPALSSTIQLFDSNFDPKLIGWWKWRYCHELKENVDYTTLSKINDLAEIFDINTHEMVGHESLIENFTINK